MTKKQQAEHRNILLAANALQDRLDRFNAGTGIVSSVIIKSVLTMEAR